MHLIHRYIEDAGNLTQHLGLGRVVGQIYAYLYFSPVPRSLSDLQSALGISKGSASMVVRQLQQWDAVRKIWVKGDRKDYYAANEWIGQIVRNVLRDTLGKRLNGSTVFATLDSDFPEGDDEETRFIRTRLAHARKFQKKVQALWGNPIVRALLKE